MPYEGVLSSLTTPFGQEAKRREELGNSVTRYAWRGRIRKRNCVLMGEEEGSEWRHATVRNVLQVAYDVPPSWDRIT